MTNVVFTFFSISKRLASSLAAVSIGSSVSSIGASAFSDCTSLTGVTIPGSVTSIGSGAFVGCANLIAITVDELNSSYSSLDGVLFTKDRTTLLEFPAGKGTTYAIHNGVTSIGYAAFMECSRLSRIIIPSSVTFIGEGAFALCSALTGTYFQRNAPATVPGHRDYLDVFLDDDNATVYYLPGTAGWDTWYPGRQTAVWLLPYPVILATAPGFGVQTNGFGFTISWATNASVVVETSTNLSSPVWLSLATNTLTSGWSYFSDPQWTNYPARFYRIRSL